MSAMSAASVCELFERAVYTLAEEGDNAPPGDPRIDALFARATEFAVGKAVVKVLTTEEYSRCFWYMSAGGSIATHIYAPKINGEEWLLILDDGSGEDLLIPPAEWEALFPANSPVIDAIAEAFEADDLTILEG